MDISNILKHYDLKNITVGVLGGHSALDVCAGAKKQGFKTVCVAQKDRAETYRKYYHTRNINKQTIGCVDQVILVDQFTDILNKDIQEKLRNMNTIFIHNRYFWVYFKDFTQVENNFKVPIFGSRELLKLEERDVPNNQYYLLEKAGIRMPKIYKTPQLHSQASGTLKLSDQEEFSGLTLTKVNNATRTYERENFVASNLSEWQNIAEEKIKTGKITLEALQNSVIEEFILGAQINFNFFYSPINQTLELMGTDMRRQTNLDGFLRLPAYEQMKIPEHIKPAHIETGHVAITCKESLLEKAFLAGESFVKACNKYATPIIGPFALQGAIETDGKKEELVVFDVSFRIPGSPGIMATPYTNYLYGQAMSTGERIAIEIKQALQENCLIKILT